MILSQPTGGLKPASKRGSRRLLSSLMISTMALSACSSTIHTTSRLGSHNILAIDAKQRVIISGTRWDGQHVVCTEPSPDAVVASAAYAAGTFGLNNGNKGQGALGTSEAVSTIGIRTQTIQMLRDGYFRICEAYLNGAIDRHDYDLVILGIDTFMITLVAIQAVTGAITAPGVAIAVGGEGTLNPETNKIEFKNKIDTQAFKAAMGTAKPLDAKQIAAVEKIVQDYIRTRGAGDMRGLQHIQDHEAGKNVYIAKRK